MNPMRATMAIMMALLIQPAFPQDNPALTSLKQEAEQGNALAQYSLGAMYHGGEGVPQDFALAHMWYNLAASRQTGDERQFTAQVRSWLEEEMTREQIAEAQRLAREWKPKGSGSQ